MGPRLGRRGAEVKCGLRAACCRFDEASLLAVGVWVLGFVLERKDGFPRQLGFRAPSPWGWVFGVGKGVSWVVELTWFGIKQV